MMANLMRQMGQEMPKLPKTLELNINHPIITKLKDISDEALLKDSVHLLFDSAKILESSHIQNTKAFTQRIYTLIEKSL